VARRPDDGSGWPEHLVDYIGWEDLGEARGAFRARITIRPEHLAPNGFLQASVVVALADLCCASGTFATIPEGASFTTVELKTNLVGTALAGHVRCEARLQHGGRTTQVWDAVATHEESGRKMALFRCTQLILYSRS
jgi:1,4-dihydroxy-2-naphthoyl-CoA hydrolase